MPRTSPSIEKIRAELVWVNETPDRTNAAAAIYAAARKLDTGQELAPVRSQLSSGRSDGSTTVNRAVITDDVVLSLAGRAKRARDKMVS